MGPDIEQPTDEQLPNVQPGEAAVPAHISGESGIDWHRELGDGAPVAGSAHLGGPSSRLLTADGSPSGENCCPGVGDGPWPGMFDKSYGS